MHTIRPRFLVAPFVLSLLLAACGSSGDKFPATITVNAGEIQVVQANSEVVQGSNRVAYGLIGTDGLPIVDANVHMTFYDLNNGEKRKAEMDAISSVPARDAGIQEQVAHVHADGKTHTHFNAGEEIGIYVANVDFDTTGNWGAELKIKKGDINETRLIRFNVIPTGSTPPIGGDAPRSENLTVNEVTDITQIDTSSSPSEELHTETIKQAIESRKPTLVLFAVPGYCTSRLCGPELEIMRKMYPEWRDKAEFIHVEFYKNPGTPQAEPVDAVKQWGLLSEPWFFVIDGNGKIAAKFEGPTSMQEIEAALTAATQQ
jgi:hypothetical protein